MISPIRSPNSGYNSPPFSPTSIQMETGKIPENWQRHRLDEVKSAILELRQEGLIREDLQAAFFLTCPPLTEECYQELEERLNFSFQNNHREIFSCGSLLTTFLNMGLPISHIQIIGSSIPLSNAYLLNLFDNIHFHNPAAKERLAKIIGNRSRSWNDLDIRLKLHPCDCGAVLQCLKQFFGSFTLINQANLNNKGMLYSLGHPDGVKLDLTFLWDGSNNSFQFTGDSMVVEILPFLQNGAAFPLCIGGSVANWMLHHLLNITSFYQNPAVIDRSYFPKFLCQMVKGAATPNGNLPQILFDRYFEGATTLMDTLHLLQRGAQDHLPKGTATLLAYWMNCFQMCRKFGATEEQLAHLRWLLMHEKNLNGLTGEIIKGVLESPAKADLIIALLKIIALVSYFEYSISQKGEPPMTASFIGSELYLDYPIDPKSKEKCRVLFSMDLQKEIQLLATSDLSTVLFLLAKLPFSGAARQNPKDPADFGFSLEGVKSIVYGKRKELTPLALLFLKILTFFEPGKERLSEVVQILPAALWQLKEHKCQHKMIAAAALILGEKSPCLKPLQQWAEQPGQTKSSLYRALLEGLFAIDPAKGCQLFYECRKMLDSEDLLSALNLCLPRLGPTRRGLIFNEMSHSTETIKAFLPYLGQEGAATVKAALEKDFLAEPLMRFLGAVDLPALEEIANASSSPLMSKIAREFRLKGMIERKEWEQAAQLLLTSQEKNDQVFEGLLPKNAKCAYGLYLAFELPHHQEMAAALFHQGEAGLAADILIGHPGLEFPFLELLLLHLITRDTSKAMALYGAHPYIPLNTLVKTLCERHEEMYAKRFLKAFHHEAEWQMIADSYIQRENYEAASHALRQKGRFQKWHQSLTHTFIEKGNFRLAEFHLAHWEGNEWAQAFHAIMEHKVALALPPAFDPLIRQEQFPHASQTAERWQRLLNRLDPKEALTLYPKTRHFFSKPQKQELGIMLLEKNQAEALDTLSRSELTAAPLSLLIPVIQQAAPTYPKIEKLLELLLHLKHHTEVVAGWIAVLKRMNDHSTPAVDLLLLQWFKLVDFGKVTQAEAEKHLQESEFWSMATNDALSPLVQREFVTEMLKNIIRIVFKETKPPKNQIPLLWFAHSLQKSFDSFHLENPSEEIQRSYLLGEKELIETIGRIIDHKEFQEMARQRLAHFTKISRKRANDVHIDSRIAHHLNPTEYYCEILEKGLLAGSFVLAGGIISMLVSAHLKDK